jgi:hypothetical protein
LTNEDKKRQFAKDLKTKDIATDTQQADPLRIPECFPFRKDIKFIALTVVYIPEVIGAHGATNGWPSVV